MRAVLVSALLCLAPLASAAPQLGVVFDRCGVLIEGVECSPMFQEDAGCIWILEDYGGMGVGERVRVTGIENHDLASFCQQECGFVLSNTIGPCFTDFATPYCSGFASGCPCANPSLVGGCANASGSGALLEPTAGSASTVSDDLVLTVSGVEPGEFGILFMGSAQIQLAFGDGVRCVGAGASGVFRFPPQQASAAGTLQLGPGIAQFSQANFLPAGRVLPGSQFQFQGWYRDPGGPCAS